MQAISWEYILLSRDAHALNLRCYSLPDRRANWVVTPTRKGNFEMTNSGFHTLGGANPATAEASFEFGRRRVLLRQRLLLADGVPTELGARSFELLLTLLEAEDR